MEFLKCIHNGYFIVILLWMFRGNFVEGADCDKGWFGSNCQYKCQCTNDNCDDQGKCTGGATCVPGWFGPQCQYADLVYMASLNIMPLWVRDNNDSTCNPVANSTSLELKLDQAFHFTWLRIYVSDSNLLQEINIKFGNTSGTNSGLKDCVNIKRAKVNDHVLDIQCDLSMTYDRVILSGKGTGSLCSLFVSGGRNVALKQSTSTQYPDFSSDVALDGNVATCFPRRFLPFPSRELEMDWTVTFQRLQLVNRYVLLSSEDADDCGTRCFYPDDSCRCRLANFTLRSFSDNNVQVFSYQDNGASPQKKYSITPVASSNVEKVIITPAPTDMGIYYFTLCEVEIYGDSSCSEGKFGRECEHTCNCADSNTNCLVNTGSCPTGCAAGFRGEGCQEECPQGTFGRECSKNCSDFCAGHGRCQINNGTCLDGCKVGFMGPLCDKECSKGTFGPNCSLRCSDLCAGDGSCHHINGTCLHGCEPGYTGPSCDKVCENNKYDANCEQTCSDHCKPTATPDTPKCYYVTGACLFGCQDGYEGYTCTDETNLYLYMIISWAVAAVAVVIAVGVVIGVCCCSRKKSRGFLRRGRTAVYDVTDFSGQESHVYRVMHDREYVVNRTSSTGAESPDTSTEDQYPASEPEEEEKTESPYIQLHDVKEDKEVAYENVIIMKSEEAGDTATILEESLYSSTYVNHLSCSVE